jgi:hypothetical protein
MVALLLCASVTHKVFNVLSRKAGRYTIVFTACTAVLKDTIRLMELESPMLGKPLSNKKHPNDSRVGWQVSKPSAVLEAKNN